MAYQVPLKYNQAAAVHEPMAAGDKIALEFMPISAIGGNTLQTRADGLYVGQQFASPVIYVSSSTGTDASGYGGRQDMPMRTLEYALDYIRALVGAQGFRQHVVVALKAGDTFVQNESFYMYGGQFTLTFYGDPTYGNWYDVYTQGADAFQAACASDLQRPIVNCGVAGSTSGGSPGFVMVGSDSPDTFGSPTTVMLLGVRINLPGSAHSTGQIDYVSSVSGNQGKLILKGAVINITNTTSTHGLFGVECSSRGSLYQFGSQLLVSGQQVTAGATVAQLQARKYFIKLYPDFLGNHQNGIGIDQGSPGSALIDLSWSDTASLSVGTKTNQATYPVLNNPTYGLANYIYNLTRDQQSRPLNVLSGRLF